MTPPERLLQGRYRLDEALTRRAASATWLGEDLRTGERCVVKELSVGGVIREGSTELSYDGDFTKLIDLFEREARVLANLDHPGIPDFIDHFREEVDGDIRLFTVQEFVDGTNLQDLVASGRHLTEDEAVEICREVTEILGFLHDRSPPLIHRDVKPANIILGRDGDVHLVDFGSVRNLLEAHPLDGKTIVGTYGYMPIEQYEARAVPQSDFYALGMTLIYLLSHREPTEIPRTGLALDFRGYVNVSERFARLIGWMIEPAATDRPTSASAILDLLDPKRRNLPDVLPYRAVVDADARPAARTRIAAGAALVAGLLGFLIAVSGFFGLGLPLQEPAGTPSLPDDRIPTPSDAAAGAAQPLDGTLSVDLDRDFTYVTTGFPMGRAAHQTSLDPLTTDPPPGVGRVSDPGRVHYGTIRLGNGPDADVHFALAGVGSSARLYIDRNNNEDLLDDGPPLRNEGSGAETLLATTASVDVDVQVDSELRTRPYRMWVWFNAVDTGQSPRARMYALHHYAGQVRIGDRTYQATVFEQDGHDALYRDAGICIDLDADGRCAEESELFHDGDLVRTPTGRFRLVLDYP